MKHPLVSIIIPVFMNESSLHTLYIQIKHVIHDERFAYTFELIFIDDGSTDNSYDELNKLQRIDAQVRILRFTKNFGQLQAIKAGLQQAKGDCVINMSADLQDPPTLIKSMLAKWKKGYKIVICSRSERDDGVLTNITSGIFYKIMNSIIPGIPKNGFDYFLLDTSVVRILRTYMTRHSFIQGEILLTGYTPYYIPYKRLKRMYGTSQWTLGKKVKYFIDGIITLSDVPIRLVSFCGILFSFTGFCYASVIVALRVYNKTPFPGYAPIMIILLFATGMIMITTGIIGEYIWRIYDQLKNRPEYIIKQ
jgi:glycosyltransferase involved in cell wall biosynthesis